MEMLAIFGNSMTTGKYAKGSNEPLGIEETENQVDVEDNGAEDGNGAPNTPTHGNSVPSTLNDEQGASSSATRPNKRAKIADFDVDPLVGALTSSSERLATAIEKLAKGDNDLPPDLYDVLKSLPGFNSTHISFYYSYLVANPHMGRAFYNLPFDAKIDWVVDFITQKFPGN